MKRIIFFISLLISVGVFAQDKPSYTIGLPGQTSHARGNLRVDSTFLNPLRDTTFTPWRLGLQIFRPADSSLYVSTSLTASQKWTRLGSGSAVGDSSIFATRHWTNTQLATKQNSLTTGTTAEYFRGDLSLSNFSSDVTAITDGLYSTLGHTHDGLSPIGGLTGYILKKNSNTDYDYSWQPESGSMVYPGAGIPVSTGSAWSTSLTNTTIGTNFLTATNPGAAGYFRTNADNTITHRTYAQVLSDIGATAPQTWQQTLTTGSTLTGNNTISNGNNTLTFFSTATNWESNASFTGRRIQFLTAPTVGGKSSSVSITDSLHLKTQDTNGPESEIKIKSDSIVINPHEGNLRIVGLDNEAGTKALRINPTTGKVSYADTSSDGGSVVHQNLANTALLANGDYTHWWSNYRLKIVGFDQFDFLSDTAANGGRYGLSDWKTSKGKYLFSFKDSTAGSYGGPNDSLYVLESFNAISLHNFKVFPDSIALNGGTYKLNNLPNKALGGTDSLAGVDINGKVWKIPAGTFSTASHTHAASDVTSGTIATARLGSGTANSTKVLAGDQTWKSAVVIDVSGATAGDELYWDGSQVATRAATGGTVTPTGWLSFQVDITENAPEPGDNLLQNDSLIGKRIEVYREGLLQDSSATEGFTFNSGAGEITFHPALSANQRIKIHVYDEESIYDIALETPPPPGYNSFDFTIKDGTLTESPTDVWNGTGSYGNNGLAPIKLPASTDGSVRMQYTSGSVDNVFGFISSYALTNSGSFDAAVFINSGTIYRQDGGSSASTGISISVGDYLKVYREGSVYKAAKSPDGTSWTDVYTYTHSGSGIQFVGCDVSGKLSFPAEEGLIDVAGDNYASGTTALTFPTNTNQTNTSGVITASGSGYGQTGLSGSTLPSSTDGWIGMKYSATDAGDGVLGFNTTNAQEGLADFEACFWILSGGTPTIYYRDNGGGSTSSGVNAVIGDFIRMNRTGSTIKLQRSQDGTSWTDIHTYTFSSSATLYIGNDLNGPSGKMYYPQKQ